jgi:ABC-type multidrug transport system ATPase subunit
MSTLISCQNVNKFFGAKQALKDVSFELNVGETTALVGPNGAGKTTLFSILCNYHLPSSGQVSIFGQKPGSTSLVGKVGALPQDAQLDPRFAIKHQLELYAKLQGFSAKNAKNECLRVLERVELSHVINERPAALSHGMRKRVTIAQALIGNPQLVMLDEPTAGLDPANARNIRQLVMDLSGDASFIISSHNLEELERLCSTVLLLEEGQLSQQAIGQQTNDHQQSITLLLEPTDLAATDLLASIQGVSGIESINKQEFILKYNALNSPSFDIELIQALQQQGLQYRQLTKGLSLEQQLFA